MRFFRLVGSYCDWLQLWLRDELIGRRLIGLQIPQLRPSWFANQKDAIYQLQSLLNFFCDFELLQKYLE